MSEGEVQTLRTEFQGLEKRLTDRFDRVHNDEGKSKLDKINGDIRGSGGGNVGLNTRVDRLETSKKKFFLVVSVLAISAVNHYLQTG